MNSFKTSSKNHGICLNWISQTNMLYIINNMKIATISTTSNQISNFNKITTAKHKSTLTVIKLLIIITLMLSQATLTFEDFY